MSWTFTTSGSAIKRAGFGANADIIINSTQLAEWSDQAEGAIVSSTRKNYLTKYSGIDASIQNYLADIADALIARKIINHDPRGYGLAVAQTIQDILVDDIKTGIAVLKEFKTEDLQDI